MKRYKNTNIYVNKNGVVLQAVGREREGKTLVEQPLGHKKNGSYDRVQKLHWSKFVHVMVWETFVGSIPEGYEIDHIDFDTHNNALDNLRCIPSSDNNKRKNPNGKRNHHPVIAGWNKGLTGDGYKSHYKNGFKNQYSKEVTNV